MLGSYLTFFIRYAIFQEAISFFWTKQIMLSTSQHFFGNIQNMPLKLYICNFKPFSDYSCEYKVNWMKNDSSITILKLLVLIAGIGMRLHVHSQFCIILLSCAGKSKILSYESNIYTTFYPSSQDYLCKFSKKKYEKRQFYS